jgi:hypothetical protein
MSDQDVLWHSFAITHVLDCIADPTKNRVIAELSDDISPVFPYLNAIISNLMYIPGTGTVTIKREWRILTFYPHVAVMAKVDGAEDAAAQVAGAAGRIPAVAETELPGLRRGHLHGLCLWAVDGRPPPARMLPPTGGRICRGWPAIGAVAGLTMRMTQDHYAVCDPATDQFKRREIC